MTHSDAGTARNVSGAAFLAPSGLEVTPLRIDHVLLLGRCLLHPWIAEIETSLSPGTVVDFVLFNNLVDLPEAPPREAKAYAFQVVSLPLRIMLPETFYLGLAYSDIAGAEALFQGACDRLDVVLDAGLKWTKLHGLRTFVTNFLLPQQNPDGRLLPRHDLRNLVFFIEKLNEHLAGRVATYRNAAIVDIDAIAASIGRRHVQDDALWHIAHGSILTDHDAAHDALRLEPPASPPSVVFELKTEQFIREVWQEIRAMVRTLRRIDPVKLVIVDLDDTLWRGVPAELDAIDKADVEGWPLGVVEALMVLKRRGVLLAIASKNEDEVVARIMHDLYAFRIHLSDFALRRIGWAPKTEMIAEMLGEANLLARNVVFIDDNPVEREAVALAFPEMRVLGSSLYAIRRDLLWSAETQVATITTESERRGAMVQAQVAREAERRVRSRADFLATLGLVVELFEVGVGTPRFPRAVELLDKTNQFNTTGRRWRGDELVEASRAGLGILAFTARDRFTDHGLVGVVLVAGERIPQVVMSCRVIGLGVEAAVLRAVADYFAAGGVRRIVADFVETSFNMPCRALYADSGFEKDGAEWACAPENVVARPEHVALSSLLRQDPG